MRNWRDLLPPELLAELDALNGRAADVRRDQAALAERVEADALEAAAAGDDERAAALTVLAHELGAVLGDVAEQIATLETRIAALERLARRLDDCIELDDVPARIPGP